MNLYDWYMQHKNKDLTKEYLINSFELMIKEERELLLYIHDFQIIEEENDIWGTYSNDTKEISINKNNIEKLTNSELYGLETIRHEMEHARNLKILEERRQDIETLVISYALKDYALKNGIDLHTNIDHLNLILLRYDILNNYETNPGERLAEIRAWKYLINLLKTQRTSLDLLTARKGLYYSYIQGYENNRYYLEAPTYQFLLNTKMFHEYYWLEKRVKKNDYSFETRLMCGLPLTEKEYNQKILQKVKLQKKGM